MIEESLRSTEFLNYNNVNILEKAIEITKDKQSDVEKAKALFYWVRDEIKYNMAAYYMIKSNFKASVTLRRGYGFCVSKAVLLSAMCRAVGIPAKIHIVDIINHKISQKIVEFLGSKKFYCHGYSEILLNDKWIKATPVFDKFTAMKAGYLPMAEFDGKNDGILSKYDVEGNKFIDYFGDRGSFNELPYAEIATVINEKYAETIKRGFSNVQFLKKTSKND